jgi:hypothetical protein
MVTIGQSAKEYEPKQMKNIADLEVVEVNTEFHKETRDGQDGKYEVSYIIRDNEEYRVPSSVLEQLKGLLEGNPNLKTFMVKKTGQGMGTKYQVIPLS